MYGYRHLHEPDMRKATYGQEPASFDELLSCTLKSTVTCMSRDLTLLQHYLKFMHTFGYTSNRKRWLSNSKSAGWLERDLE